MITIMNNNNNNNDNNDGYKGSVIKNLNSLKYTEKTNFERIVCKPEDIFVADFNGALLNSDSSFFA